MTRRSVPIVTAAASVLWTSAVLAGVGAQAAAPVRVVVLGGPVHAIWYVQVPAAVTSPARLSERRLQVPREPVEIGTAIVLERASRSLSRPPLPERSRWSTQTAPRATSSASASRRSAAHGIPASTSAASPSGSTGEAQARALPEPWRSIVACESLGDRSWRVGSVSRARGFFQFMRSTWASLGRSGDPAAAPFAVQYAAARELRARDGLGAWDCARILGLA